MTTMPTQTLAQPNNIGSKSVEIVQQSPTTSLPTSSSSTNFSHQTPCLVSTPVVSPSDSVNSASIVINGREARNLAEKHRRDKLNASISELAKLVPRVADSPRRLDKTSVLRLTTHGLRLHYVFGKSAARRRTLHKGDNHIMTDTLLQLLDSFFITLTCHGQIVLISSSVEHLLGYCQSDLYGQNILQITHPDDQEMLRQELIPSDIESLFYDYHDSSKNSVSNEDASFGTSQSHQHIAENDSNQHVQRSENYLAEIDEKLRADKRCFTVRLSKSSNRSESKKIYEVVKIDGCFRRSDFSALATGTCNYPIVSQLIRRSRNNSSSSSPTCGGNGASMGTGVFMPHLLQHDAIAQAALHGVSGNDIVLVAMARIIRPPKLLNYSLEANSLEYKTRHLIDGRIIDCDNRIGLVAGYLKEEVCNLSPFSFMHQDDVRWVIVALRQMYDCNSDYGESCFRLLSRNGKFIYLNSKGYLEIDKGTNKVHSFVCVNTLLDEEEGKRKVQEMKNKFSIIINAKVPANTMQDAPASQNPQQLERIVLYLIEDLQKRESNVCVVDEIHSEEDAKRHSNTPPLALVPPEPASVKSSISKSVSVVISTAAKSFAVQANSNEKDNINSNGENNKTERSDTLIINEQKISTSTQTKNNIEVNLLQRPSVLHMNTKHAYNNLCSNSPNKTANTPNTVLKRVHVDLTADTTSPKDAEYKCIQPAKRIITYSSNSSTSSALICPLSNPCLSSNKRTNGDVDIHDFISSSLRHVGESLENIDTRTSNLRQHYSTLPICLDNKLDAIIIEQKKQSEFLTNIKHEYKVYREECPSSSKCTQNLPNQNQQIQLSSANVL